MFIEYQIIMKYQLEIDDKTGAPIGKPKLSGFIPKHLDAKKPKVIERNLSVLSTESVDL